MSNLANISKKVVDAANQVPKPVWVMGAGILSYFVVVKPLMATLFPSQKQDEKDAFNKEVGDIANNPANVKQSLPDAVLKNIAEIQLAAMDRTGTDENLLIYSLQGLNATDLKKVFLFFGKHNYHDNLGQEVPHYFPNTKLKDLFGWYYGEVSEYYLKQLATIWQPTGLWRLTQS